MADDVLPADEVARQRFWAKVNKTPTCWLWTGGLNWAGYGRFNAAGRGFQVHRFAYETLVGPIPDGLVLDHVRARGCENRHCVNPAHLEPVTSQENTLRGDTLAAQYVERTHCSKGHEFTPENTYTRSDRGRRCRRCRSERERRRKSALRKRMLRFDGGLCECGCGGRTTVAIDSDRVRGLVKGEARRFIPGHNARLKDVSDAC